jgi:hypothetical protein
MAGNPDAVCGRQGVAGNAESVFERQAVPDVDAMSTSIPNSVHQENTKNTKKHYVELHTEQCELARGPRGRQRHWDAQEAGTTLCRCAVLAAAGKVAASEDAVANALGGEAAQAGAADATDRSAAAAGGTAGGHERSSRPSEASARSRWASAVKAAVPVRRLDA